MLDFCRVHVIFFSFCNKILSDIKSAKKKRRFIYKFSRLWAKTQIKQKRTTNRLSIQVRIHCCVSRWWQLCKIIKCTQDRVQNVEKEIKKISKDVGDLFIIEISNKTGMAWASAADWHGLFSIKMKTYAKIAPLPFTWRTGDVIDKIKNTILVDRCIKFVSSVDCIILFQVSGYMDTLIVETWRRNISSKRSTTSL